MKVEEILLDYLCCPVRINYKVLWLQKNLTEKDMETFRFLQRQLLALFPLARNRTEKKLHHGL